MAYQLAEVDETAVGARLAEDSTAGSVPALSVCFNANSAT